MAYRRTLVNTARELLSEKVQPSLGLLGVFEEPHKLVTRVRWLEKPTWIHHRRMVVASWMTALLAAPFLLPMAAGVSVPSDLPPTVSEVESERSANVAMPASSRAGSVVHHVSNEFHVEIRTFGLRVSRTILATSDTWVGAGIIAGTERGRTTVVDRSNSLLTLIDHRTRTWARAPLPLDVNELFTAEALQQRAEIRTSGEVEAMSRSRKILGRRCPEFKVVSWKTRGGGEISERASMKVWATEDVPFDVTLFDDLLLNLRLIYNRDAAYRQQLGKIRGLQMGLEMREGGLVYGKRYIDQVVAIEAVDNADEVFAPPPGYRRLDQIESIGL